jgi:flagellar assembly factor FliW
MNIDFAKASAMELAHGTRCAMKTVRPENVFSFPEGLLGFQEIKQYVFILNERLSPSSSCKPWTSRRYASSASSPS